MILTKYGSWDTRDVVHEFTFNMNNQTVEAKELYERLDRAGLMDVLLSIEDAPHVMEVMADSSIASEHALDVHVYTGYQGLLTSVVVPAK